MDVLLGIDWFKQTGVILDPKNESFIIPQRIIKIKNEEITVDDQYELSHHLNMLNIEHDEMEFIDDYACFESDQIELESIQIDKSIDNNIAKQLRNLLKEYESSFAISAEQLGCCKNVSFDIEVTSEHRFTQLHTDSLQLLQKRWRKKLNHC